MDKPERLIKLSVIQVEKRDWMIRELKRQGLSLQEIADLFSKKLSKARIQQIVKI